MATIAEGSKLEAESSTMHCSSSNITSVPKILFSSCALHDLTTQ